ARIAESIRSRSASSSLTIASKSAMRGIVARELLRRALALVAEKLLEILGAGPTDSPIRDRFQKVPQLLFGLSAHVAIADVKVWTNQYGATAGDFEPQMSRYPGCCNSSFAIRIRLFTQSCQSQLSLQHPELLVCFGE